MRERTFRIGNLSINLIEGDIAKVKADALVTAVNSGGAWFGGIDGVIQRAAGMMFHKQALSALPLGHADTTVARKDAPHRGTFGDVVFVIDDLEGPLSDVISAALVAADEARYASVSLPAIRTGVMLGAVEKDAAAAARETVKGLKAFVRRNPSTLRIVTIVIYNQRDIFDAMAYDLERA